LQVPGIHADKNQHTQGLKKKKKKEAHQFSESTIGKQFSWLSDPVTLTFRCD
jgi:hypothetical protein